MKIKSKIWIEKDGELVFGTGKSLILKAVDKAGSINKAARQMNMSFRRAWSCIKAIEKRLGTPLLIIKKGGKHGGGAILTSYAKDLIKKFEKLENQVKNFVDKKYKDLFS